MSLLKTLEKHFGNLEVAAKTAANKTKGKSPPIKKTLHAFMQDKGFKKSHEEVTRSKSRYTKRTPGTDDWNAHRSLKQNESHSWTTPDHEKFKDLHNHLTKTLGMEHTKVRANAKYPERHLYLKGKHFVRASINGNKRKRLDVYHTFETSKPDLEYERSGRGRGQII